MRHANNQSFTSHRQLFGAWSLVVAAVLFLGVLLGIHTFWDYQMEAQRLEARLLAQARVVDENLNANLNSINLILENIKQELNDVSGRDADQVSTYLKKQSRMFAGVKTLLILDKQGLCIASSRDELVGKLFNQRDYFTTPRDSSDKNRLFMSPPFKTYLKTFVINISKPILGKQGDFNGVVAVSLSPEYFHALLESTIYTPDNRIALVHADGTVFTAAPEGVTSIIGKNVNTPNSQLFHHLQSTKTSSIQSGRSSTTGDKRIFAYITNTPPGCDLTSSLSWQPAAMLIRHLPPGKSCLAYTCCSICCSRQ